MTLEMYFYIVGTKMFSRSHPGIGFSECGTQARFRFPVTMVAEHAVQPDEHAERHEAVNYVSEQWPRLFLLVDVVSQHQCGCCGGRMGHFSPGRYPRMPT